MVRKESSFAKRYQASRVKDGTEQGNEIVGQKLRCEGVGKFSV